MSKEYLSDDYRVIWSQEGSSKKTVRSEFERRRFLEGFTDQLRYDNTVVTSATFSGRETLSDIKNDTAKRTVNLEVGQDLTTVMTPEEFKIECRKNQISA